MTGVDEMNALHLAARDNQSDCVDVLLRHWGTSENRVGTDAWRQSPIHTALAQKSYQCAQRLLGCTDLKFDAETTDTFGNSLLFYLDDRDGSKRRAGKELLVKHYKKLGNRNGGRETILHHAIRFLDHDDFCHLTEGLRGLPDLTQRPFHVDVANGRRQTPLHLAVLAKKPEIVEYLVLAGASPSVQDDMDISPMILACQHGDAASAHHLLWNGEYCGAESDKQGKTALHHAASSSWLDDRDCLIIVQKLARVMKSIDVRDREDKTPLQSAIAADKTSVCLTLLRNRASMKMVDMSELRALDSIVQSAPEAMKELRTEWESQIRKQTQEHVNEPDRDGETALHIAIRRNDLATVDWLMQNNADLDKENYSGRTAFIESCCQNKCHMFIEHIVASLNSDEPESTPGHEHDRNANTGIQQLGSGKERLWSVYSKRFDINKATRFTISLSWPGLARGVTKES
jgi:ankyrin repeat protein